MLGVVCIDPFETMQTGNRRKKPARAYRMSHK